ncbi:uncharacterized protein I303_101496 [Kwoniella dejecticola CBS 10117]|uniref:Sugar phosphate phosphatase n=1 Tax=Kwoniella dejecticola CBS 10117 TaxID=1296121 RepID=A0A1A6ADK1_9TREE|nr:uncharacterized protein I303_02371 [Kwoniella dejecticola CBS 10117]OBR88151.1 hypothetical protein I303_02371 [Kwoniella dejecticola CBS 10117]
MPFPGLFKLPYDRCSPKEKKGFAYTSLVKRWPVVLTNIVSAVSNVNHELHMNPDANSEAKLVEGKKIISQISQMKYDMGHNAALTPIENDGDINRECYNDELRTYPDEDCRWGTMNWLYAECYMYRRLRSYFASTVHWKEYDPFFEQKAETYKSSSVAIVHLAKAMNQAVQETDDLSQNYEAEGSALEIAFLEMIQADLWGNATDLSLLVDLKYEDIQKLQAVGSAAQQEQAKNILRNDLPRVWSYLKTVKNGRVDIILDNAGFELFTDLILADFLVSCTPFVDTVVFHPKAIPWFVSDVLPYDFTWAIDSLLDSSFFASHASTPLSPDDLASLSALASRWKRYLDSGKFKLSVPADTKLGKATPLGRFWTTQYAFQDLPEVAPGTLDELRKSDLVIFKGDLNYRKLVGDAWWPTTTPFEEALGPLAGKITLLSLRTNKADTVVGLEEGVAERLDKEAPDWRISGKYAVVSFSERRRR